MQSLGTEAISTDPDVTEITVAQLSSVCELQQEWPNTCEGNGGSLDKGTPTFQWFLSSSSEILHRRLWYRHLIAEDSYWTVYMTHDQISNQRWQLRNKNVAWRWGYSYCLLIRTNLAITRGFLICKPQGQRRAEHNIGLYSIWMHARRSKRNTIIDQTQGLQEK